jgi:hypothetical protein
MNDSSIVQRFSVAVAVMLAVGVAPVDGEELPVDTGVEVGLGSLGRSAPIA